MFSLYLFNLSIRSVAEIFPCLIWVTSEWLKVQEYVSKIVAEYVWTTLEDICISNNMPGIPENFTQHKFSLNTN